jgi:P pilus assembly chaperone PapD
VRTFAAVLGLAGILAIGADARASTIGVAPVRLEIDRSGESVDLTLQNQGAAPTSFTVRGFAWRQLPSGEMDLEATSDLIVYPQRVTLGPQEKRAIRIGYPGAVNARERDYRIIATEAAPPPSGDASSRAELVLRTRLSVPLFVRAIDGQSGGSLSTATDVAATDAAIATKTLSFALTATGPAHVVASSVNVRALDESGAVLVSADLPAWYLLPSEPRLYRSALPDGACARVRALVIDATFESGRPLHAVLEPKRAC